MKLTPDNLRYLSSVAKTAVMNNHLAASADMIESLRQRVAEFEEEFQRQRETAGAMVSHRDSLLAACEKELEFAKAEITHLHLDIEEARRDTIRQVVRYLQLMHEMVKDKHNNYMVAANLINGEFNANNQHETSNQ